MVKYLSKKNITLLLGLIVVIIIIISSRVMAWPAREPSKDMTVSHVPLKHFSISKLKNILFEL